MGQGYSEGSGLSRKLLDKAEQPAAFLSWLSRKLLDKAEQPAVFLSRLSRKLLDKAEQPAAFLSRLSRKLLDKAEQPAAFLSRVDAQLHEVLFGHVSAHAQGERQFWTHKTTGWDNVRQCCGSGSVDPYRTSDWRIRILLQILLFFSVTFKMATKFFCSSVTWLGMRRRESFGHKTTGWENVRQCSGSGSADLYLWPIFVSDLHDGNYIF